MLLRLHIRQARCEHMKRHRSKQTFRVTPVITGDQLVAWGKEMLARGA
ncbi:MAG: hypothetical protein WEC75_13625 [Dehalococcoidia bacterium]